MIERGTRLAGADEAGRRGLADGNLRLGAGIESLPRADARSAAVAAASVVAKVLRDGAMRALSTEHPEYGFDRHAGYGTAVHRVALAELGRGRGLNNRASGDLGEELARRYLRRLVMRS